MVEFAFLAPFVLMLTVGAFEMSMAVATRALLDGGTREAARFGITGEEPSRKTREQRIREIIGDNTHGLVSLPSVGISLRAYETHAELLVAEGKCTGIPGCQYSPNPNDTDGQPGEPGPGGSQEVVVYEVNYQQPVVTPLMKYALGIDRIPHNIYVVVQNEPF
jgi:hypothetical protein